MRRRSVVEAKVDRVRLQLQPSEQRPRRVVERHGDKLGDPQRKEAGGKILDKGCAAAVGISEDQAIERTRERTTVCCHDGVAASADIVQFTARGVLAARCAGDAELSPTQMEARPVLLALLAAPMAPSPTPHPPNSTT